MISIVRCGNAVPRLALAGALLAALLQLAGCVAIQDEDDDMVEIPPSPVVQKPTPAPVNPGITDIVILDMHEEAGPDPSLIKVVGTIVNRRNQEVTRLVVRVEARDAAGRTLTRVTAPALAETIPAGGTSTFEASVPRFVRHAPAYRAMISA